MATRGSDPILELLNYSPGQSDLTISGSKLPTFKQVLLCLLSKLHQLRSADVSKKEKLLSPAAHFVYNEVCEHYSKANIPTILTKSMINKILALHEEFRKIQKVPSDRRQSSSLVKSFREKLEKTMPFYPSNAEKLLIDSKKGKTEAEKSAIDEDILFLKDMMDGRNFTYASRDKVCSKILCNRAKRANLTAEFIAKGKEEKELASSSTSVPATEDSLEEATDDFNEPPPKQLCTPNRSHKRSIKTGSQGFWSPHILKSPKVVETAVRNNISATALAALATSFVEATNADPAKINLSYGSSQKARNLTVKRITEKIKASWTPPLVASIHWDGKLMETLGNESSFEERLPILLSGVGGVKLLGVPKLPHKNDTKMGPKIAGAALKLVEEWECDENVKAMVFDTTSANTGALTAGCISMQNVLNKELLWLACRHHIGERVLVHVWDSLDVEVSKSPDINLFQR